MSNILDPLLEQISKLWSRIDLMPTMRWGTVLDAAPLSVQLDGDTAPLPFPPASVVFPIREGARVLCVEQNRRVTVVSANVATRGTTAQRDAVFGAPATDAGRVALANTVPTWFNIEKGYQEVYYATTGLAGLTAVGLVAGYASGWYPAAGSRLSCTRIQQNGFQGISAGVVTAVNLAAPLVNIGGFASSGTNGIGVPIGGSYTAYGVTYFSGGGAMAYTNCLVRLGSDDVASSRVPGGAADVQHGISAPDIRLAPGAVLALFAQAAANHNVYGDGINRRTFLSVKYEGPPLVNA